MSILEWMLGKQILHRPRNYTLAWGLIGRHASSGGAITSIWLRYIRVRRSLVTVTRSVTPRKRFRLRLPHRVRLSQGCVTWAWRTANGTTINHAALNRLIDVNIENTESFNIQRCIAIISFESARVKVLWIVSDSADLRMVFAEHLRIAHLLFSVAFLRFFTKLLLTWERGTLCTNWIEIKLLCTRVLLPYDTVMYVLNLCTMQDTRVRGSLRLVVTVISDAV